VRNPATSLEPGGGVEQSPKTAVKSWGGVGWVSDYSKPLLLSEGVWCLGWVGAKTH
jgi:hypothetical protein